MGNTSNKRNHFSNIHHNQRAHCHPVMHPKTPIGRTTYHPNCNETNAGKSSQMHQQQKQNNYSSVAYGGFKGEKIGCFAGRKGGGERLEGMKMPERSSKGGNCWKERKLKMEFPVKDKVTERKVGEGCKHFNFCVGEGVPCMVKELLETGVQTNPVVILPTGVSARMENFEKRRSYEEVRGKCFTCMRKEIMEAGTKMTPKESLQAFKKACRNDCDEDCVVCKGSKIFESIKTNESQKELFSNKNESLHQRNVSNEDFVDVTSKENSPKELSVKNESFDSSKEFHQKYFVETGIQTSHSLISPSGSFVSQSFKLNLKKLEQEVNDKCSIVTQPPITIGNKSSPEQSIESKFTDSFGSSIEDQDYQHYTPNVKIYENSNKPQFNSQESKTFDRKPLQSILSHHRSSNEIADYDRASMAVHTGSLQFEGSIIDADSESERCDAVDADLAELLLEDPRRRKTACCRKLVRWELDPATGEWFNTSEGDGCGGCECSAEKYVYPYFIAGDCRGGGGGCCCCRCNGRDFW